MTKRRSMEGGPRPATRALLGLATLLLAALACGRKNAPLPPELVRPHAPVALAALSTADGVRVTWLRPLRYSGGQQMNDLDKFLIDRAMAGDQAHFERIATVQLEDRFRFKHERRMEWVDAGVQPGSCYAYQVIAVTRDGSRSNPAGPVSICFQAKGAK